MLQHSKDISLYCCAGRVLYGSLHLRAYDWVNEKPVQLGARGYARQLRDQVGPPMFLMMLTRFPQRMFLLSSCCDRCFHQTMSLRHCSPWSGTYTSSRQ